MLPGFQTQAVDALVEGFERKLVVEVDVRNDRDGDLTLDGAESLRGLHIRHGAADNLTAHFLEAVYLRDRRLDVAGVGLRHGLNADRSVPAYFDVPYPHWLGYAACHTRLPSECCNNHTPAFRGCAGGRIRSGAHPCVRQMRL